MGARATLVVLLLLALSLGVAWALSRVGNAASPERPVRMDAGASPDAARVIEANRVGPDGEISAPPNDEHYRCVRPRLAVREAEGCASGAAYPACVWELPDEPAASGLYRIWRNTTPEHRWGRPALVALVLAAAREYAARWPGEQLTVGDLDAPGPRHQTHNRGVDVDLYLPHAMADRNEEGRAQTDNYFGLSRRAVRLHRARVLDLGKMLASCSRGRLRIYYADRPLVDEFRAWFTAQGLVSDVAPQAMQMHNALHRFHFHMTVADDLPVLPEE